MYGDEEIANKAPSCIYPCGGAFGSSYTGAKWANSGEGDRGIGIQSQDDLEMMKAEKIEPLLYGTL